MTGFCRHLITNTKLLKWLKCSYFRDFYYGSRLWGALQHPTKNSLKLFEDDSLQMCEILIFFNGGDRS
jgi:hypothetical protein